MGYSIIAHFVSIYILFCHLYLYFNTTGSHFSYLVALSLQQEDTGPAAKDAPPTGNEWRMPEGQELSE